MDKLGEMWNWLREEVRTTDPWDAFLAVAMVLLPIGMVGMFYMVVRL